MNEIIQKLKNPDKQTIEKLTSENKKRMLEMLKEKNISDSQAEYICNRIVKDFKEGVNFDNKIISDFYKQIKNDLGEYYEEFMTLAKLESEKIN